MPLHARTQGRHERTSSTCLTQEKEENRRKEKKKEKGASEREKFWEIWLPHKCTSFPSVTNVWFLCLKKVLKECDYDESAQFACDTEKRMNGHVKSMNFQQFMGSATSKCPCI